MLGSSVPPRATVIRCCCAWRTAVDDDVDAVLVGQAVKKYSSADDQRDIRDADLVELTNLDARPGSRRAP